MPVYQIYTDRYASIVLLFMLQPKYEFVEQFDSLADAQMYALLHGTLREVVTLTPEKRKRRS